jgi:phosphoribosylanthranilate isomerase
MTAIKICGITRVEDAIRAADAGATYIGINFWPRSKRFVDLARGTAIADAVRGRVTIVGVFVDQDPTQAIDAVRLDIVQLHGNESPITYRVPVWKALAIAHADRIAAWPHADAILLDNQTPGSGTTFDWSLARDVRRQHPHRRIVLAGGLTPDNVAQAIVEVAPFGVDVASGVESAPGIKDAAKVTAFVAAVRG